MGWITKKVRSGDGLGWKFFTVDPNCADAPHPTRWCRCKNHATALAAQDYIEEMEQK